MLKNFLKDSDTKILFTNLFKARTLGTVGNKPLNLIYIYYIDMNVLSKNRRLVFSMKQHPGYE